MLHPSTYRALLLGAGLAASSLVQAQSGPKAGKPDPLNPMAAVPAVTYTSPLARYRPAGEFTVGSWQAANETVTRIGGWRAYTREANQPDPAPPPPSSAASAAAPAPAATAPKPMDHGGHGKH